MKAMRHLLISAAALLLAGPALAQSSDPSQIRGKGGFGQYQQLAQNGGPTTFTNQLQGQQPGPNGEPPRGDRGDRRGQQVQPQTSQQQMAPQGRDNRQGGNNGRYGSRDNNRSGWDNNNRGWDNNRGRNDNYRGGYSGRRDWRSYGNYHRDWRPTRRYRAPVYNRPRGWYSHRWTFGEILPSLFWARDYWLDYRLYDLPPPPYGAVWVRVGDDALMIDDYSGEIITVAYNVFY
jgi:hypothetical protein